MVYLAHTGDFPKIRNGQPEIRLEANWQHVQWPDGKTTNLVIICAIYSTDSSYLIDELSEFLKAVDKYKFHYINKPIIN